MRNPLITVYITNYNYGKFIKKAIESVLGQTEQDFELIIIDDGSTDNSKDIIKEYEGVDKVKVVFQKNKGLTYSNNIALRLARGKYIVRLDADDYFDKNALSVLSNILEKDDEVGMVFSDWYLIDEEDHLLGIERRHDFKKEVSIYDQPAHGACTMFRTSFLRNIDGYDENLTRQDGYELWFRFIDKYKIENVNIPLFYYRQHSTSLTKNERKLLETRANIFKKHAKLKNRERPKVLAILPIRGAEVDHRSQPFLELGNKYLIDWTVEVLLNSKSIDKIIITTPSTEVLEYVKRNYKKEKLLAISRPKEMARINTKLDSTINHAIAQLNDNQIYDYYFFTTIETPFKREDFFDSAISVMSIFDINTVIGVRPETNITFQHKGKGLVPVNNFSKMLRLERDQIYTMVSGYTFRKVEDYNSNFSVIGDKIGHIVIDQESALAIRSDYDYKIANYLLDDVSRIGS